MGNKPTDLCEGNQDARLDADGDGDAVGNSDARLDAGGDGDADGGGDQDTNADVEIAALPLIPFRSTS